MKHKLNNYDSRKIRKTIGPIGGRTTFPSERQNNKETQELVKKLGGKVAAECWRKDLEMTRKSNKYDNLSTTNDGCSWENIAEEEHQNPMVAMATNDLAE